MSKKIKCNKCGTSHNSDIPYCPVCGEKLEDPSDADSIESIDNTSDVDQLQKECASPTKKYFLSLIKFESRETKVDLWQNIILFLTGLFGLYVLIFIVAIIILMFLWSLNITVPDEQPLLVALNYGSYFILLGILLIILSNNISSVIEDLNKPMKWLKGLYYGVILIVVSLVVSNICYYIGASFEFESTSNENQLLAEAMTVSYPILSIIVVGIIAPICEEFTYRVGLFSGLKRINRTTAYIVCTIVFGLIHFSFEFEDTNNLINELINLPTYMVAGLLLCYFYDKSGLLSSIVAHATNNLFSTIITLLYFYLV